jgi:hypothetical protein
VTTVHMSWRQTVVSFTGQSEKDRPRKLHHIQKQIYTHIMMWEGTVFSRVSHFRGFAGFLLLGHYFTLFTIM